MPPNPKAASSARHPEVDADTSPALRAALAKPVPVGDLPVRVFVAPFRGTGSNGSVLLAIEIDGQSLTFLERTGRFVEKVEVSIVAADQRAKVQATDHQAFDMNLLPQNHDRVRTAGLRLLSRLEVPPARYHSRRRARGGSRRHRHGAVRHRGARLRQVDVRIERRARVIDCRCARHGESGPTPDGDLLGPTTPRAVSVARRLSRGSSRRTTTRAGRPTPSSSRATSSTRGAARPLFGRRTAAPSMARRACRLTPFATSCR